MQILKNNLEKSSATKIGEHILGDIQCKLYERLILYKVAIACIVEKILCKSFVFLFENMKQMQLILKRKNVVVNKKRTKITTRCNPMLHLQKKVEEDKSHLKVRDHCHFTGKYRVVAHSICSPKFNIPNEIPVIFHSGSKYDYHLQIISGKSKGKFESFEENTESYKKFSVPIKKEIRKVENGFDEDITIVFYKIKFIDSRALARKLKLLTFS